MYKFIRVDNMKKLLEQQVNSRGIAIYFILFIMASRTDDQEVLIYDFNAHKLKRYMKARGIDVSYQQVVNSIKELVDAGMISYDKPSSLFSYEDRNRLRLVDAFVEQTAYSNEVLEDGTVQASIETKQRAYIHLNRLFTEHDFYKLNVRAKRMLIYLHSFFAVSPKDMANKTVKVNLRKDEHKHFFRTYMHLGSEQMVLDTLEEISSYIQYHKMSKKWQKPLTCSFHMKSDYVNAYGNLLLSDEDLSNIDKKLFRTIRNLLAKYERPMNDDEFLSLCQTLICASAKHMRNIIMNFLIYNTDGIKESVEAYFRNLLASYFNKTLHHIGLANVSTTPVV